MFVLFVPVLVSGVALGQTLNAESALLRCAQQAQAEQDQTSVRFCLRGWASLQPAGPLPEGLQREAQEAKDWARTAGTFVVFGSRLPGRVRVGVKDPAQIAGRVEVYAKLKGQRVRLRQLLGGGPGRLEYQLPEKDPQAEVIIEVWTAQDALIRRSTLAGGGAPALPKAPNLKAIEAKLNPKETAVSTREEAPVIAWWWIAAGALAAGLAGAAIWQETRF